MKSIKFRRKTSTFKKYRRENHYSISDIKRELEKYWLFYSLSTIYKWDIGHRFPDLETLDILAKIFHAPIESLLRNPDETTRLIDNKTLSLEDKLCCEIRKSSEFYQRCLNLYIDYLKDNGEFDDK